MTNPYPWVDEATFKQIAHAAKQSRAERVGPVFDFLGGQTDYTQIRLTLACLRNRK
jgi:hypothetical protein